MAEIQEEAPLIGDETPPQPPPDTTGDAKLRLLHMAVGKEYNLGSFEEFKQKIQDPAKRQQLYNAVGKEYNLGSYDDFETKLGFKNKSQAANPPEHELTHTPLQDIRHVQEMALKPVLTNVIDPDIGGSVTEEDPEDAKKNKAYNTQYDKLAADLGTQWGTKPNVVKQVLRDFPDEQDESKLQKNAALATDNPASYGRLKNANDIRLKIAKDGPDGIHDANVFNHLLDAQNYHQLTEENLPYQIQLMRQHNLGQEDIDQLKEAQRPLINSMDDGLLEKYWNSKDKEYGLTSDEYAGLETERLFNPNKAAMDESIIKHSRGIGDDGVAHPLDMSTQAYQYQRGVENIKYNLQQTGRKNLSRYIDEHKTDTDNQADALAQGYKESLSMATNPVEHNQLVQEFNNHPIIQEANKLQEGSDAIKYSEAEDYRRYPLNFADQSTRAVTDAMDHTSGVGKDALKIGGTILQGAGENADNTIRFIKNTAINLLASDEYKAFNSAQNIGHQSLTELSAYEPTSYTGKESPILVPRETTAAVQGILNGLGTDADKQQKAISYIRDNFDKLQINPKSGQQNMTGKVALFQAANVMGQILGVANQSFLLGGVIGDASKLQQMATAFTPMYMSTQNQMYEQALKNGDEHPLLKSNIDAAIISLASLINPDLKVVRAMAGADTGIGKMIAGIDESTWNKVLSTNKPLLDRAIVAAKATGRQLGLANLQYGVIAPTAQYLAHKSILNEDPNLGDMIKDGVIQTSISMALPSLLHGVWGGLRATEVNPNQKYAIVEAGLHPDQQIDLIESKIKDGTIPEIQGHEMKQLIKHAGEILQNTEMVKTDGTPMNEKEVPDVVYNMLRKRVLEGKMKTAAEPVKPIIEEKIHEINKDIADLHTSDADKHKNELNQLLHDNLDKIKDKVPEFEQTAKDAIAANTPEEAFKIIADKANETKTVEGKETSLKSEAEELYGKPLVKKALELSKQSKSENNENSQRQQADQGGKVTPAVTEEGARINNEEEHTTAPSFLESRHADTIDDEQGKVSGPNDNPISNEGRKDANSLAESVKGKGVTKVITSDLERSKQTGQIVADKTGATIEHRPELNTWDIGDFDKASDEEFKKAQRYFVDNPDSKEYEGRRINESFNEYKDRVIKARTALKNEPSSTLVVNHSNNMMLWDAFVKNGHEWNGEAEKDYLSAKAPEPATLTDRGKENSIPVGSDGDNQNQSSQDNESQSTEQNVRDLPFGRSGVGIAERVQRVREYDTGVKTPESGKGLSAQEGVDKGRELLINGADPDKIIEDFNKDNKISADTIGVVRAKLEQLSKETNNAIDKYGDDSVEAKAAIKAEENFAAKIQPMQTEWHKIGMTQQGEVDLDTGTVASIKRAFREQSGKSLTEKQTEQAKEFHSKLKEHEKTISKLQAQINELINKQEQAGKGIKEQAKDLAKKIRDNAKLNRPGMFSAATPASLVWDTAVEVVAKSIEAGGAIAEAIGKGIDHIKESEWYKGLSDSQKDKAVKQFEDWHKDEATSKIDIKTHFVDKKDNNFSPNESKAIWELTKEVLKDGKTDFHDVINQVAMDTGLSADQVRRAISQPKGARIITDKMYAEMYRRNQVLQSAKIWVKSADQSSAKRFWNKVIKVPSAIVTFGHGSVAPITHVGADLYRPSNWKSYFTFMLDSYKYSFGGLNDAGKAKYEKAMADLVHDPMFIMAKRAGLKIDPTDLSGDDYSKYQGIFGKISKMGERGFNAMKPYRLEQFKKTYNGLSDQAKGDPEVVKAIAHMVNLSSGTTDAKIPKGADVVMFAPKLVVSQYQRIFSEPAKAVITFAKWKTATEADKLQAKIVARHAGEMVATYLAALAANQAILSMTGSKQKVNFTDPLSSDWMKFKVKDKDIDASGGMNSSLRFVGSLVEEGLRANGAIKTPEKSKPGDVEGRKILQQATNKLSPFAGDIAEGFSGTDIMGHPLPWSSVKPSAGREKLTWGDYVQGKLPIPLAEGFKSFHDAAKENGVPASTFNKFMQAVLIGGLTGTTGAKISPDTQKVSPAARKPRGS